MAAAAYIISRSVDPIFAVFIGLAAATTRIRREESEKGRTPSQTFEVAKRRLALLQTKLQEDDQ